MTSFDEYRDTYKTIKMERRDGILSLALHTDGGPLHWSFEASKDCTQAFRDIGDDPSNKVIILTGTGSAFTGPRPVAAPALARSPAEWEVVRFSGTRMLANLLAIEAPVISAINGPTMFHMELPLVGDMVLATDDTVFQDAPHLLNDTVPGDGLHVVLPLLMGLTRARYFLYTGQTMSASEAQDLGLVNEVLPREKLMARAWELAEQLAAKPDLVLRYTRLLLTQTLRRHVHDLVGYGFALEGAGVVNRGLSQG